MLQAARGVVIQDASYDQHPSFVVSGSASLLECHESFLQQDSEQQSDFAASDYSGTIPLLPYNHLTAALLCKAGSLLSNLATLPDA